MRSDKTKRNLSVRFQNILNESRVNCCQNQSEKLSELMRGARVMNNNILMCQYRQSASVLGRFIVTAFISKNIPFSKLSILIYFYENIQ